MYHDILSGQNFDSSGFPGPGPATYKISEDDFRSHCAAIRNNAIGPIASSRHLQPGRGSTTPIVMSFDDGGVSAYETIAPILEDHGWIGYFFVTADRIGEKAFLSRMQIADLHSRGHLIGSHSYSHPKKISECSISELDDEWQRSTQILSEIIAEPVTVASIPGGFYSGQVVERAAYAAGICAAIPFLTV